MSVKRMSIAAILVLTVLVRTEAQQIITALRVAEPIEIDGSISDEGWSRTTPIVAQLEVWPAENIPARQRTEIRLAYTDQHLYVSYVCFDSDIGNLRAHISERDNVWQDDFVSMILDTYGDQQKAYDFVVNPYGIQGDGLITQGPGGHVEDISYDAVWYSAASMNDSSWIVEIAIPLSSLQFPDKDIQKWSVYLSRGYPRATSATFSLYPWNKDNPCTLCQLVPVRGVEGIQSTTTMNVLPYVIGTQRGMLSDRSDPQASFQQDKILGRAGLGLKIAPLPDLSFEAVVNPDFSQIESDATQISVNTTFALFYPERRPFFLEGSDLFQPSVQGSDVSSPRAFYSRTVNDPLVAAKVIGKSGSLSYAVLSASDRNTNLLVPGEEESDFAKTGRTSLANVARVRYSIGEASFIGGLASTRHLEGSGSNLVFGVDWGYRFWDKFSFDGVVYLSRTEEPNDPGLFSAARTYGSSGTSTTFDGDVLDGYAATLRAGASGRNEYFSLSVEEVSPLFQSQNGFVALTNKRTLSGTFGKIYWPESQSSIVRLDVSATGGVRLNHDGIRKERFLRLKSVTSLRGQVDVVLGGLLLNEERFRGVYVRDLPQLHFGVFANPTSSFSCGFGVEAGYFLFRGALPERGYGHVLSLDADVRFTDRFKAGVSYNRARLAHTSSGSLYYDGNIYRLNSTYHFSPQTSVRLISQYDSFARDFHIYPLFSVRVNAFTFFYAGATGNAVNFGDPTGFRTTETNYFLKCQYLIQW